MKENNEINISVLVHNLGLSGITSSVKDSINDAEKSKIGYEQFLRNILQEEYDFRQERLKVRRLKASGFPQLKYLEDLNRECLPTEARQILPELEKLDFIRNGNNVILYGNPGTGKTHTAIGLGIRACQEKMSVLYTSVPHLITQIKESRSLRTLHAFETRFKKYDLVICDEFGYISCDKEGGELLFNHLSLRAETKSTIITTNLSFDKWSDVIKDKVLVNALADRLVHKAYIVNMMSESYRYKETKEFNEHMKANKS